ncbi:MAG: hypothetical protein FWF96_04725 [Kiritimatiellaeota bacterium]|nr:hypothetical protein [Kiritimatiellota bacterium]
MKNQKLHFIGNAHLDPIWLWRWQEGYAEVKATFASAIERMKEYPEFIFTCSSAQYYKWVEENCPPLFEEVKKFVKNGQWKIVGGWWTQSDTNIPGGEGLARHALYSQRYFLEKFGVMAKVGYNVDSFGHSASLPQILKKSGMDYYVFKNPGNADFPWLFRWVGHDGSEVVTYRIRRDYSCWDGYPTTRGERGGYLRWKAGDHMKTAEENNQDFMCFFGVGNHGGGPTIAHIETIKKLRDEYGADRVLFSTPEQYFASVDAAALPVYAKELNHAARGGYSANADIKKFNRRAEHRLLEAETFNVLSHQLTGCDLMTRRLAQAWENVMLIHFHDAICGVSVKPAYPDMCEFFGETLSAAGKVANHSLQKISWGINTQKAPEIRKDKDDDLRIWEKDGLGAPLVVFNPLSWDVEIPIDVNKTVRKVEDASGNRLDIQHIKGWHPQWEFDKWHTLFYGKIPAMGYAVFWIYRAFDVPDAWPDMLGKDPLVLENDHVRVEFEKHTGHIKRYFDKTNNVELLRSRGAVPQVFDEYYDNNWSSNQTERMARFSDAAIERLEDGPLRQRVRVTSVYNRSELRQDFILHRDSGDLEIRGRLVWLERHKMLKIAFQINADDVTATYETPYGCVTRGGSDGEVCGGRWMDVTGVLDGKAVSLAILNDCKYGHELAGNDARMTVVRSPLHSDGNPKERDEACEFTDIGLHEFTCKVVPGVNQKDRARAIQKAFELNMPVTQIFETYHEGPLPQTYKGIEVSANNVLVTALKESEDGAAWVLRCYETVGRETPVKINVHMLGRTLEFTAKKFEVKTVWLPSEPAGPPRKVNFLEM